jgi:dTMP kinase
VAAVIRSLATDTTHKARPLGEGRLLAMASGKFITFEGGEGSGKSTQARLLADRLKARGIDALLTREPGGSPFAERVRALLLDPATPSHAALCEALLFYAARADHLDKTIRPALAAGRWIICDRFSDSTRVYQGVAGGLREEALEALERLVVVPTRPHLTFILDLPPMEGLARVRARGKLVEGMGAPADPFEGRDRSFHEQLRKGYAAIAKAEPRRCTLVDAGKPADVVAAEIWALLEQRLLSGAC